MTPSYRGDRNPATIGTNPWRLHAMEIRVPFGATLSTTVLALL
jgi:hypothetical protein